MNSPISRTGLWRDIKTQSTAHKIHQCIACGRTYSRRDHLRRHARVHSCAREFSCGLCDRSFTRQDLLRRHVAHVHNTSFTFEPTIAQPFSGCAANGQEENSGSPTIWNNQSQLAPVSSEDCTLQSASVFREENAPGASNVSVLQEQFSPNPAGVEHPTNARAAFNTGNFMNSDKLVKTGDVMNARDLITSAMDNLRSLGDVYRYEGDLGRLMQQSNTSGIAGTSRLRIGNEAAVANEVDPGNSAFAHEFRQSNEDIARSIHEKLFMVVPAPLKQPRILDQRFCQIDAKRLIELFKTKVAPHKPFLHFPTLAWQTSLGMDEPSGCPTGCMQSRQLCKQRTIPPHLLLMILASAAAYDLQPSLAHLLFTKGGSLIRDKVRDLRSKDKCEPPIHLIQAMMLYITFGMSFGEQICTENMMRHLHSLSALVADAKLSRTEPGDPSTGAMCQIECKDLDGAWLDWVAMEERRRTFYVFLYNSSAVAAYINLNLGINIDNINLQLPASEALWAAETSNAWAAARLQGMERPATFGVEFKHLLAEHPSQPFPEQADGINELGCTALISALNILVYNMKEVGTKPTPSIQRALKRWKALWLSISQTKGRAVNKQLMGDSLPLLNHIQLMLCDVDLTDVKNALLSRDFDNICAAYSRVGQDDMSDFPHSVSPASDGLWTHKQDNLRSSALYAIDALEMALKHGMTLGSDNVVDMAASNAPVTFHCAQIIITWLEAASHRQQGDVLYGHYSSVDIEDCLLISAISKMIGNYEQRLGKTRGSDLENNTSSECAIKLLGVLAELFDRVIAWPVFKVFSHGLQARRVSLATE